MEPTLAEKLAGAAERTLVYELCCAICGNTLSTMHCFDEDEAARERKELGKEAAGAGWVMDGEDAICPDCDEEH